MQLKGGAAILAPITAFPNGVPGNALILFPINPNGTPVEKKIVEGPVALQMDEVWKLLGFNGPAVQVQDEQGRPIAIGLEDLLAGLEKHWNEGPTISNRGRIFAQELMKHGRHAKAEQVLSKIVALGGDGEDWLGLGVAQLAQEKLDKAEATLKGAQNLLKDTPFPSLHLAKVMKEKDDRRASARTSSARSRSTTTVDAWAYLSNVIKEDGERGGDGPGDRGARERAGEQKSGAPYVALQGFYATTKDETRATRPSGSRRRPSSARRTIRSRSSASRRSTARRGKLDEVIKLLAPHEAQMQRDVRLAHNYFEALFQSRDMQKITALLNKLATSQVREVKQFAIERSRAISQMLASSSSSSSPAASTARRPDGAQSSRAASPHEGVSRRNSVAAAEERGSYSPPTRSGLRRARRSAKDAASSAQRARRRTAAVCGATRPGSHAREAPAGRRARRAERARRIACGTTSPTNPTARSR